MKIPTPLVPPKWAWHHRTLTRLHAGLLAARQEHAAETRWPHERGGADVIDFTEGELELRDLRAELAHEDSALAEVEAALRRLREGRYGICEDTGARIPAARLRVLPWTRFTRAAAARREKPSR
ncbi:MAG: TraR/DksA family transcriptional regulator [Opitutaceae bacterium]